MLLLYWMAPGFRLKSKLNKIKQAMSFCNSEAKINMVSIDQEKDLIVDHVFLLSIDGHRYGV